MAKPVKQDYDYEILVIGAGPGGYETAIKASQTGKKTCIVEGKYFGGTCLNIGCMPAKALIKTAEVYATVKSAAKFGVEGLDSSKVTVSYKKMLERKNSIVKTLTKGVQVLLRANKVSIENGYASFIDEHRVQVGEKIISAKNIIIATGSEALVPSFIKQTGENNLLTSDEALNLDYLPENITIIGAGVIGVEFAYLFNKLGAKVTVLELMDYILPMVDKEVSDMARKRMEKDGIKFHLNAKVKEIKDNSVIYELDEKDNQISSDAILMAVGRVPNTAGLNAEGIGIEFDRNAIKTDEYLRTNIANIYAIGDVNGKVMLAHTASHEGFIALDNICGKSETMNYSRIPSCIYTNPEIASIGLTEEQAKEKHEKIKVGRFPAVANGKSLIEGDRDGIFKTIIEETTGEILGVHLYGQNVTEMIGEIAVAMTSGTTADKMLAAIHPHPTINESLGESFMSAVRGKVINFL